MFKRIKDVSKISILLAIGKVIEWILRPLTKALNTITEKLKTTSEDIIRESTI